MLTFEDVGMLAQGGIANATKIVWVRWRCLRGRPRFDLDHHEIPTYLINFPDSGIVHNSTFLHQKKEDSGAHIWGEVIDYAESDSAMIRVMFLLICM